MSHPLAGFHFRFAGFKGFGELSGEPISFSKINIVVGRNNAGKSALIDALEMVLTSGKSHRSDFDRGDADMQFELHSALNASTLRRVFREGVSQGGVPGQNHWSYGQRFLDDKVTITINKKWERQWVTGPLFPEIYQSARSEYQGELLAAISLPVGRLIRVSAERDVKPEIENEATQVAPGGVGLTNIIRAFLYDSRFEMAQIEVGLLADLNRIYRGDVEFDRVIARKDPSGNWEVYLQERGRLAVRLSESGSSLKSIFIILAILRLNPIIQQSVGYQDGVFCVEEPENNLHPALLRRLLDFLQEKAHSANATLLLTTHSSTAIDWGTRRDDCTTLHIRRVASDTAVSTVREYVHVRSLIQDLDIRASEILQANGIIWVEGPSDRIYINAWVRTMSDGKLVEGIHYSVMFYGGKLLSHLSSLPPDEVNEAISLLRLNRNCAVMIDSDRKITKSGKLRININATKRRIEREVLATGGFVWITAGREIENYIHADLVERATGKTVPIGKHESVLDRLAPYNGDKISLAHDVARLTTKEDLVVLDLYDKVYRLCSSIYVWNALEVAAA